MTECGCAQVGVIVRIFHSPSVWRKMFVHILCHRARQPGDLEKPVAAVTAFSRQIGGFGRGQALKQVEINSIGGGRIFDCLSVLIGPADHLHQSFIVEAAIGGIDLVGQDDPAGLFFPADQGTVIAESPGDVMLRDDNDEQKGQSEYKD